MDQRWYDYLVEFHATRDYYACHDYLEEWWFELNNPKNHILVGFIQVAVGMYQWRRGNVSGAKTMFTKSMEKFQMNASEIENYGIHESSMMRLVERLINSINQNEAFYDINLPIVDFEMEDRISQLCDERNIVLYHDSDLSNDLLINKHIHKHKK